MSLRIGRVKIGDGKKTAIGSVSTSGDAITINGHIYEGTGDAAEAKARQLAGLLDIRDEPFVPIVRDDGPLLSGFVRVTEATTDRNSGFGARGSQPFTLGVERLDTYASPLFETTLLGGMRAGVLNTMTPQPFHALPGTVQGYEIGIDLTATTATRVCEGGTVSVFTTPNNTTLIDPAARPSFYVPAEDWYMGAATIYMDGAILVGQQIPNRPKNWTLSNGLVRISGSASGLNMERFASGAWGTLRNIRPHRRLSSSSIAYLDEPHTVTILRNSPEEAAVRLTYQADSQVVGSRFSVYVDLSLRRGSKSINMRLSTRGFYPWGYEMTNWGSSTGTTLTGGSALSGVVIGRDPNMSLSLNGTTARTQYVTNASNGWVSTVGYYEGATTGTGIDTAQSVLNQWACSMVETVEAVAR